MKRLLPLLLALSLLLSGCGKVDDDLLVSDPLAVLREYYGAEIEEEIPPLTAFTLPYRSGETWDPILCRDGIQQTVSSLLYETLFVLDEHFTPQPLLVREAVYNAEELTYTLYLRSDVRFRDGTAMTAQDVASSLLRAAASERYGSRLHQIETVAVEDGTVVVTLNEDNGAFPALLDIPVIRSGTEEFTIPVGTGPYVPTADMTKLIRSEEWWQSTALPFTEIALRPYKSEEAAAYAFLSHDVHLFVYAPLSDATQLSASQAAGSSSETAYLHYLGINMRSDALADPITRQIISLAIDRQELTSSALSGHADAAHFPVSPASALYPDELVQDRSAAALYALMQAEDEADPESGEEAVPLRLIVNSENPFKVTAAGNIAAMLNLYGFAVTVDVLSWDDYLYALSAGRYDLYYGECKLSADWDITPLIAQEGSLNFGGYANEETEGLLSAFRSAEADARPAAAEALYRQLQQDVPLVPLFFERIDLLLTPSSVDNTSPTAADPFYGLEQWQVNWSEAEE